MYRSLELVVRLVLVSLLRTAVFSFFFFNDTATTEIYTLSLHDALPISPSPSTNEMPAVTWSTIRGVCPGASSTTEPFSDRKSTRLNSSHMSISYAVFCLKKKKQIQSKPSRTFIAEPAPAPTHLLMPLPA